MHHPKIGEVLLCDFRGFEKPEMIKRRPVVVITERLEGRTINLLTIVPLSGQASDPVLPYQVPITLIRPLSPKFDKLEVWAKCDMVAVVSRSRLDRFKMPRGNGATPIWLSGQLTDEQVRAIRIGVMHGLRLPLDKLSKID